MKKNLLVVLVSLIVLAFGTCQPAYAAGEAGEGTAEFGSAEVKGGEFDAENVLTFTVADTNMVAGYVGVTFPAEMGIPTTITSQSLVAGYFGVSTSAENIAVGNIPPAVTGQHAGITVAASDIGEIINIHCFNISYTAVAASQDMTVTMNQAADSTDWADAAALAADPVLYLWTSQNNHSVAVTYPTPSILTTDTDDAEIVVTWKTTPGGSGELKVALVNGTPAPTTTPAPASWSLTPDAEGYIRAEATAGQVGTGVITGNSIVFPMSTPPAAGDEWTILIGDGDIWQGGSYMKNASIGICSNAEGSVATMTPTPAVTFTVRVPTATVGLTMTYKDPKSNKFNFVYNNYPLVSGHGVTCKLTNGTRYWQKSLSAGTTQGQQIELADGYHSITMQMTFKDQLNDGEIRVTTSNAYTANCVRQDLLEYWTQLKVAGSIVEETFNDAEAAVGDALITTKYAYSQVIGNIAWTSTGTGIGLLLEASGNGNTLFVISQPAATTGMSPPGNFYILDAATEYQFILKAAGTDDLHPNQLFWERYALPAN